MEHGRKLQPNREVYIPIAVPKRSLNFNLKFRMFILLPPPHTSQKKEEDEEEQYHQHTQKT